MIEANRAIYRDKAKVVPIIIEATKKPKEAVEFASRRDDQELRLVGQREVRSRTHRMAIENSVSNGDIEAHKKPSVEPSPIWSLRARLWKSPAAP